MLENSSKQGEPRGSTDSNAMHYMQRPQNRTTLLTIPPILCKFTKWTKILMREWIKLYLAGYSGIAKILLQNLPMQSFRKICTDKDSKKIYLARKMGVQDLKQELILNLTPTQLHCQCHEINLCTRDNQRLHASFNLFKHQLNLLRLIIAPCHYHVTNLAHSTKTLSKGQIHTTNTYHQPNIQDFCRAEKKNLHHILIKFAKKACSYQARECNWTWKNENSSTNKTKRYCT